MLHSNPLEAYFENNPDKRPDFRSPSTANWRGYVATFEITNNSLYLKDLEGNFEIGSEHGSIEHVWKSVFDEVVPAGTKLKIDWLTGILVIPHGELVEYVHQDYASTFENYILIEISKGNFVKAKHLDHIQYEAFKNRQFEAYKKTDEYRKLFNETKKDACISNDCLSDEFLESLLRKFVSRYNSKILVD